MEPWSFSRLINRTFLVFERTEEESRSLWFSVLSFRDFVHPICTTTIFRKSKITRDNAKREVPISATLACSYPHISLKVSFISRSERNCTEMRNYPRFARAPTMRFMKISWPLRMLERNSGIFWSSVEIWIFLFSKIRV